VQLAGPTGMSQMQAHYLWRSEIGGIDFGLPAWGFFLQPAGFILFFAAAFAETKRAPFDVPEGESEIIGYFVEYSGMRFGLFFLGEFIEIVFSSALLVAIFFGGWHSGIGVADTWLMNHLPNGVMALVGLGLFLGKTFTFCSFQLLIRWSLPRFRSDQLMQLGWQRLLPLSIANVLIAAGTLLYTLAK
jgi:NADH-quinone oxidoreductase subunit H